MDKLQRVPLPCRAETSPLQCAQDALVSNGGRCEQTARDVASFESRVRNGFLWSNSIESTILPISLGYFNGNKTSVVSYVTWSKGSIHVIPDSLQSAWTNAPGSLARTAAPGSVGQWPGIRNHWPKVETACFSHRFSFWKGELLFYPETQQGKLWKPWGKWKHAADTSKLHGCLWWMSRLCEVKLRFCRRASMYDQSIQTKSAVVYNDPRFEWVQPSFLICLI